MKTTKLSNGSKHVVFVVVGERASMHNNLGEDVVMVREDAEERIGRLVAAGWERAK